MTITLYNYTGMDNVANKLLSRLCTKVWEGTITTYGAFTPRGGIFRLSNLYQCNYCTFQYDNITYYANVDVSTDSKGLYVYTCTTDSLATCFYKECMRKPQYYTYFSDWENVTYFWYYGTHTYMPFCNAVSDNRVSLSNMKVKSVQLIKGRPTTYEYIFGIRRPLPSAGGNESSSIDVWRTTANGIKGLMGWFALSSGNRKISSQLAFIYQVPSENLPEKSGTAVDRVPITYPEADDKIQDWIDAQIILNQGVYNTYPLNTHSNVRVTKEVKEARWSDGSAITDSYGIQINNSNLTTVQRVHVSEVGDIYFRFSDVMTTFSLINSIGYRLSYDFSDGIVTACLIVDNVVYQDLAVSAKIPNEILLVLDGYIQNHLAAQQTVIQGALTASQRLASGDVGGAATAAINTGISAFFAEQQEKRTDSLTQTQIVGNASSSTDRASSTTSYFDYKSTICDEEDIAKYYGRLALAIVDLYDVQPLEPNTGYACGYFQTKGAFLDTKGLPRYIVQECEQAMNTGFILAPTSANKDPYYNSFNPYEDVGDPELRYIDY